ncbi:MAG: hypothetical protein ACE5JV_03710, partial [Nitrososphaerales archaeon]
RLVWQAMRSKLLPALLTSMILLAASGGSGSILHHAEGAVAALGTDKDQVSLGQDLTIILAEPDANISSRSKDRISLSQILISTDKFDEAPLDQVLAAVAAAASSKGRSTIQTNHPFLLETGFNTSVFEVTLQSINDLLVDRGEDIRLTYIDLTSSGGGSAVRVEKLVQVVKSGIGIAFSKKEYTPFDTVEIMLLAQMFNIDRKKIDTLNTPTGKKVIVKTPSGQIYYPPMFETGMNTGTFTGKMKLTTDPAYSDGDLVVTSGDRIRVTVTIVPGFEVSDSALVSSNLGSISFEEKRYAAGEMVKVVVTDPDENKDSGAVDSLQVNVWSSTDVDGITLILEETEPASGIFEGGLTLTVGNEEESPALQVSEIDLITARYHDRTVPSLTRNGGEVLFATANVGVVGMPAGDAVGILVTEPLLLDPDGMQVQSLQAGRLVAMQSSVTNPGAEKRTFVYITHVRDADGFTSHLGFVKGTLEPFQPLKVARSWVPEMGGEYTIQVAVWESLAEPSVLSPLKKITVNVTE